MYILYIQSISLHGWIFTKVIQVKYLAQGYNNSVQPGKCT
uniref:Uncharacterized protein n=1 Tax=Anguilla anguilla TaxID=7936 RepID=A0A0E9XPN8_ANGAN